MDLISATIGVLAALVTFQWGAELWRGELNQPRWLAAYMWMGGVTFILRAIHDVAKYVSG